MQALTKPKKGQEEMVREALEHPIQSEPLRELVKGKKNIVMIASDHTRPVPSKVILPAVMDEIKAGNPDAQLTILIATGFHRPTTKEELISEGFIEPHFFAGFSGGRKSVLPGVSSAVTVMANHCSEFIDSKYARTGILDGNPIHKDMVYVAETAKLAFIVNVVLDEDKKVIKAYAGHFNEAHREGCRFVDRLSGVDARPADIVISTNGGYPLDQNIYQSVKGMTAAEATCNPGGVIIMVTSCADGHGGQSLYDTFAGGEDKEVIMKRFLDTPRDETIPDQWEAQILCRILLKYKVILVTEAPKQMVEDMQMEYAENVDEAIKKADAFLGKKNSPITVIPDGVSVIAVQNSNLF